MRARDLSERGVVQAHQIHLASGSTPGLDESLGVPFAFATPFLGVDPSLASTIGDDRFGLEYGAATRRGGLADRAGALAAGGGVGGLGGFGGDIACCGLAVRPRIA